MLAILKGPVFLEKVEDFLKKCVNAQIYISNLQSLLYIVYRLPYFVMRR
jgi:hypothetical protein